MKVLKNALIGLLLILFTFFGCDINEPVTSSLDDAKEYIKNNAKVDYFDINILSYEELPNTMWSLRNPGKEENERDKDSIELFVGQYYHPGLMASRIEGYVDSYFQTKDTLYMYWAKKYFDKLISIAHNFENNTVLFPFYFDWLLDIKTSIEIESIWYSAMTQGTVLMDATRMYEFTKDIKYLEFAKKVFNGYYKVKEFGKPWITMIDQSGYFWLEEYPKDDKPMHVLNGFIYSLMGIYEYYKTTKNEDALFLLNASLTTLKKYIWDYRNRGSVSYYALRFEQKKPEYHLIHITLLECLFSYSNDSFFYNMSDIFYQDYH